ncbi:4'-phosphopantetheinyl transferase superfamily protein [Paracoccus sp. R12_1]|uniref:4'-phosphopantetheinyl transferase family protein n=1 Tax=Paracoccus sp. TaxID=267 RepID=UPI001B152648|nr:4'-phosphopantetheinyl transferase superfamily protein [Paracoccus sp. R12_1]
MMQVADILETPLFVVPGLSWAQFDPAWIMDDADPDTLCCDAGNHEILRVALHRDLRMARPRRRREWLSGRLCAALALRRLGASEFVGMQGRAPCWPDRCTGSISHSPARVVAVAGRGFSGLGVDCELRLDAAAASLLAPAVLSPGDLRARAPWLGEADAVSVIFSAKEALFKALSPQRCNLPDCRAVNVTCWRAATLDLCMDGHSWPVFWRCMGREVHTLAVTRES